MKATDYQFELRLESGANLEVLVFNEWGENLARWIFTYRFLHKESHRLDPPRIVIDYSLTMDYLGGRLVDEFELSMHVIIPEKLGVQSFAGVDISPGAKTYLRFLYKRLGATTFRLAAVAKGASAYVELPKADEGLVKQAKLPFILLDRLDRDLGVYKVPFHSRGERDVEYFCFPESIKRSP